MLFFLKRIGIDNSNTRQNLINATVDTHSADGELEKRLILAGSFWRDIMEVLVSKWSFKVWIGLHLKPILEGYRSRIQ